jgi:glycosyltransferase involved in cell wall biosynthesis
MVSRGVLPVGKGSGGAELVAFKLAGHLTEHGEDVVLVSDVDLSMLERVSPKLSIAEVGTYRGFGQLVRFVPMDFPRWLLQHLAGNLRVARRAQALLETEEQGFDVIHVHGALAAILLNRVLSTRPAPIPLVYTEHDSTPWSCRYRRRFERSVRRYVYRQVNLRACRAATTVVTNFASLADELAVLADIPRSRFTTVRNATDAKWLAEYHPDAESVNARHGFDRYCLFVGSLVARKGPDILLHALSKVRLPCIFVGDGPMRASLERLAARLGIADRVVFTGALEYHDVQAHYSGAEALVLPSVSEGVPLVAIEALSAGVPVIASNLQGIASVVHDRKNGLLVQSGDIPSLARALSVLEHDEAVRAELRHGAEMSGQAGHDWSDVVKHLRTLYSQHQPVHGTVPRTRDGAVTASADALAAPDLAHPLPPAASTPQPERATHA